MVFGLGIGILETPILRAVSLGVIQGLYALLGGLYSLGMVLARLLP